MLDLTVVLNSELGMVDWGAVSPPSGEAPWWTCVAHLAGAGDDGYALVGALATSRAAAMIRGAGEVVERHCLAVGGAWEADLPLAAPGWSSAPRSPDLTGWIRSGWDGPTVAARNLVDGTAVTVPEALLVDRVEDRHRATNFGPSGCAAGTSLEMAVTHALLELVERDAAISAWSARRPARRIKPDEALDAGLIGDALRADVARVSDRLGLDFVWGLLPALGGDVAVAFGALLDGAGQCQGVGMKAALALDRALLGSFVESLQQHVVLKNEAPTPNDRPASDQERAAHFASA